MYAQTFLAAFLCLVSLYTFAQKNKEMTIAQMEQERQKQHLAGNYEQSVQWADDIIKHYETNQIAADTFYLRALLGAARSSGNLYKAAQAEQYCQKAEMVYKTKFQHHLMYAEMLAGWALLHVNDTKLDTTWSKLNQAKKLLLRTNNRQSMPYAQVLRLEAYIFSTESQFKKAEESYLEAKTILEAVGERQGLFYGIILHDLAVLYTSLGRHHQAEDLLVESLDILEKQSGKESHFYGVGLQSLGDVYMHTGNFPKAEETFFKCLEIAKNKMGEESVGTVRNLHQLGLLYTKQRDYSKAEQYLTRAIGIAQKINQPAFYIGSLPALGFVYIHQGRFDEAEACYQKVLDSEKESYATEQYSLYPVRLKDLAMLHRAKGNFEQALAYLMQGFDANRPVLDNTQSKLSDDFLNNLSHLACYSDETQMMLLKELHQLLLAWYEKTTDKQWLHKAQLLQQTIFAFFNRIRCEDVAEEDKYKHLSESANIIENSIHTALQLKESSSETMYSILQVVG